MNIELIQHLNKLSDIYKLQSDTFRSKSFKNTSELIKSLEYNITLNNINSIKMGSSSKQEIIDFLKYGDLTPRMQQLEKVVSLNQQTIENLFMSIPGIGPKKAHNLYMQGYRKIEDIPSSILTHAQQVGKKYIEELKIRIPRSEIIQYEKLFSKILQNITWAIAGSYRRGLSDSGDIDLLIMSNQNITMDTIVHSLSNIIVETLAYGNVKWMGITKLPNSNIYCRLDIRLFSSDSWIYALLYNTGSQTLNILMRQKAIEKGWHLNEYSLISHDLTKEFKAVREEDVFIFLGMNYLTPEERSL